jgi:hypothetical protein
MTNRHTLRNRSHGRVNVRRTCLRYHIQVQLRLPATILRRLLAILATKLDGGESFTPRPDDHESASTAATSLALNASGTGTYPLSAKPFWAAPTALCRKALTAEPILGSGYFEQTIS